MGSSTQRRDGASPSEDGREDRAVAAEACRWGFGTKKKRSYILITFIFSVT